MTHDRPPFAALCRPLQSVADRGFDCIGGCAVVGRSDRSAGPVLQGTCSAEPRLSSSTQNSAVVLTAKVLKSNPRLQKAPSDCCPIAPATHVPRSGSCMALDQERCSTSVPPPRPPAARALPYHHHHHHPTRVCNERFWLSGYNPSTCPDCRCEKSLSTDASPAETAAAAAATTATATAADATADAAAGTKSGRTRAQQRDGFKPLFPFPADKDKATGIVVSMVTHDREMTRCPPPPTYPVCHHCATC